jgi:hypothetical protein
VVYCARCRLGTIDDQGLCRLCGAPQRPPTPAGRLAEAGGTLLDTLLRPGVLLVVALGLTLALGVVMVSAGRRASLLGAPSDPWAVMAATRSDPAGVLVGLLVPALVQGLLFGLLLFALLMFTRRRRAARPAKIGPQRQED